MKDRVVTKPQLDTSQALAFATGQPTSKNEGNGKGEDEITAKNALNEANKTRVFFAPEGDRRLTINIRDDLHKKLKIAAIEKDTTAGQILEQLIEKYL